MDVIDEDVMDVVLEYGGLVDGGEVAGRDESVKVHHAEKGRWV